MSEVNRYLIQKTPIGTMMKPNPEGNWISAEDFDRVTAERDAALGRVSELESSFDELAASVGFSEARLDQTGDSPIDCANQLQQRLTAADERADAAIAFVTRMIECAGDQPSIATGYLSDILAALKPAEGGGDHVKHYECVGKGGDYTVVAIAQGAGTLKGFNHYVYKNADGAHFVRDQEDFLSRMQIKP